MGSSSSIKSLLEEWNELEGKVVLVTGASSGLGREFCLDLAKVGCKIVAAARRVDRLKSLCDEINQRVMVGSSTAAAAAVAVELDVTADAAAIETSVRNAWDAFGHIDALINNAGIRGKISTSLNLPAEDWNTVVQTNLTGAWLVSKYVSVHMARSGRGGSIINISSISGLNRAQMRGGVAYGSSKAAMDSMTRIMALELGEHHIRVNAIAPGVFPSEITEGLLKKNWIKNVETRTVPLKTFGTTDPALTSLVRFLVHDSSNYVTGNVFIVDAGYTLTGVPLFSSL